MRNILTYLDRVRDRVRARIAPLGDRPAVRATLSALLVAGAYAVGALIGMSVTFHSSPISPIWPPNAILLVSLLVVPVRRWWACLLAVCAAHMLVELPYGVPLATAAGLYVTNAAEAVLGAYGVRRFIGGPPWLSSLRRVAIYLACAVVVAPFVTSFLDAGVIVLTRWGDNYWLTWRTRCVSNSLAQLTIGPALLLGLTRARVWIREMTRWRCAEAALLMAGLLVVGLVVFGAPNTWKGADPVLLYALLPFLLWAAVRCGVDGVSVCLLGITILATWGAIQGRGPFGDSSPADDVISLQVFLIGLSAPMLFLAALMQEREEARAALQESEARFRTMADQAPALIWMSGPDALSTFFNAGWLTFTGRTLEQERGMGWAEGVHPDDMAQCQERYLNAFAARQPFTLEYRLRRHDGAYRWLVDIGSPRYAPNGSFEGYIGSAIDITDREQMEESLRLSEERYRDLVESQTEMICRYRPDTTLTFVNDAFCRSYGRPREELIGTRFLDHMDEQERDHHIQYTAALLEHPHTSVDEHEVMLPDGSIGWQQWVDHAILDMDGHVVEFQALGRDITARKQAAAALQESETRFRAAFESAAIGMMLVDTSGHPLQVNRPLVEMLGYSEEELRTHTFADFTYPDDLDANLDLFRRAVAGEIDSYQLEKRFIHKRGHLIWGHLSAGVVRDTAGRLLYLVGQVQDITVRKQVELALRESEECYHAVVTNFPHGVVLLFGEDLRHLFADGQGFPEIGFSKESVEGKTVWEAFPPDLSAALAPQYQAALSGVHAVFDLAHAGHTYQTQVLPIHYAGATAGMVILQDVTEQRRARDEIERERTQAAFFSALSQEFRTLVENSPDIITRFDRNLRHLYANRAAEALTGIPADERMGKTYAELGLPEELWGSWEQALREVFETGEPRVFETRFEAPDKPSRHSQVRYIPEFAPDGSVVSVLGITTDITDLKQIEEALRAATATAEAAKQEEESRRQEAERREQIASSLREVLTILNSSQSLSAILDYIARHAVRLLSSAAAAIYIVDDAANTAANTAADTVADASPDTLTHQAAYGLHPSHMSVEGDQLPLVAGEAAVRRAMADRRPVVAHDMPGATAARSGTSGGSGDTACLANELASGQAAEVAEALTDSIVAQAEPLPVPYRALLAVPILAQDAVYGGVLLLYSEPRRFSTDEIALAMAYGDQVALAIANARLQQHIERAAIEAERNRLARELHDTVTQEIFSASLMAEAIPRIWERHRADATQSLQRIHQITRGALASLQALLVELRPAVLEEKPLDDLLRQLGEAMTNRSKMPIAVTIADTCPPLPTTVKIALYRIAQEALMNAIKYAGANRIAISFRRQRSGEAIQLEVRDDGEGFAADAAADVVSAGHFGLGMMRERASAVGATLRITSRLGRGTRVVVRWRGGGPQQEESYGRARARTRTHTSDGG